VIEMLARLARLDESHAPDEKRKRLERALDPVGATPETVALLADALSLPRQITRLGRRHASEAVIRQTSPRGETIYWIGPAGDAREAGEGTDFHATASGCVSITPLQVDLTDHAALPGWREALGRPAGR
jgi:hypothetical protein